MDILDEVEKGIVEIWRDNLIYPVRKMKKIDLLST